MWKPKFSLGYNSDYEGFIVLMKKYKEGIDSVYFPPPKSVLGSGRVVHESANHRKETLNLIKKCNEFGIIPSLILNSTIVSPIGVLKAVEYAKTLHKHGLNNVTITDPYLIMQVKKEIPQMLVEASTICRIKTEDEAKYFKEIGVIRLTTDRETIRDLKLLRKLSRIMPIKVLANEGCMKNCIYKYSHYNTLSANVDERPVLPFGEKYSKIKKAMEEMDALCVFTMKHHPYKVFSAPFIRPEDIKRYEGISNVFKLSTRNFDTKRIEKTLKAYIDQKYDGNLVDILNTSYIDEVFEFIDNSTLNKVRFFETISSCDDDCEKCDFCRKLLLKTNTKLK
jgi:collagenase-like PrtC family protease